MTNRPVHLVLDTSAIAAFGRTVHIGEPISEVRDNDAAVALPVPCPDEVHPSSLGGEGKSSGVTD